MYKKCHWGFFNAKLWGQKMLEKVSKIATIISIPLVFSACGSAPPDCDSSKVVGMLKEQLSLQIRDMQAGAITGGIRGALQSEGAYEKLKAAAKSNPKAKSSLEEIDKTMDGFKIEFENIRATGADDKIMRSTCAAQLKVTSKEGVESNPVAYSAQKTKDGLFIEFINK
jgi:hypothetical protein